MNYRRKTMQPHSTLLKKILILFISIFIPLTLISIFVINNSNYKLKNQVLTSIDANNSNYISQFANNLDNIYINSFNMINQSNFRNFSNIFPGSSPYDKRTQVKLLREQISGICLSSKFVESAHIYFENLGTAYNSPGYYYGSFHDISEKELYALDKMKQNPQILHYDSDPITEKPHLAFFLTPQNTSNYSARIDISQTELQDYMVANSTYENEHYLLTSGDTFVLTDFDSKLHKEVSTLKKELQKRLPEKSYTTATLNGEDYYVFSYEISDMSLEYLRFIPTKSLLKNINTAPFLIFCFYLFVFGACVLFFVGIYRIVHQPFFQLTTAFEQVEEGNFKVSITDNKNDDFAYLFQAFNDMTLKLGKLIERDYNQKMLLQKAELKQLQAQINPHFLYNSFFMLQRMIKMELMEEAQEMANALGVYFRYLTRNSMDQVTLAEEYEHAKTYSYIQGLRFEGRIQIHFEELPLEFAKLPVPKLILQPLLENAFNYGLHNKLKDGLLEIHFSSDNDALTIIVEENGEELTDEVLNTLSEKLETAKTESADFEMTGLLNIQRRLNIFSNYNYSMHVSRSHMGGLCVSITLNKNITEVN